MTNDKNKKRQPITSPAGRALWPSLTAPDTKFEPAGVYHVKLILSEAEAQSLLDVCRAVHEEAEAEALDRVMKKFPKLTDDKAREKIKPNDLPIRPHEDPETGEPTGDYVAAFRMAASGVSKKTGKPWERRPALFDAKGQQVDPGGLSLWGGSILKVAATPTPWSNPKFEYGCTLRMEAVQIIQLVSGGQRDAAGYGFGAEQDGYTYQPVEGDDLPEGEVPFASDGAEGEEDF